MRALILIAGASLALAACDDNDRPHKPAPPTGDLVIDENGKCTRDGRVVRCPPSE